MKGKEAITKNPPKIKNNVRKSGKNVSIQPINYEKSNRVVENITESQYALGSKTKLHHLPLEETSTCKKQKLILLEAEIHLNTMADPVDQGFQQP